MCGILLLCNNCIFHVVIWYNNQWELTSHSARIIYSYCINDNRPIHYVTLVVGQDLCSWIQLVFGGFSKFSADN